MNHADHELIASVLHEGRLSALGGGGTDVNTVWAIAYRFAEVLGADDPDFDRARFLIAIAAD